jgi:tryptophanyl-tRNA synthetase
LQTADIVLYSEEGISLFVPVGEDQVSHVEVSREIVRRFVIFFGKEDWANAEKGAAEAILEFGSRHGLPARGVGLSAAQTAERQLRLLPYDERQSLLANRKIPLLHLLGEPQAMLTKTPRIPGLDGRKMSKSYGNAITLSESDDDIRKKTKVMVTDPARKRRSDPGNPDVCPVYDWHKLFSPKETLDWAAQGCRTAGIGCIECKAKMADHLIEWIAPIRERRLEYEKYPARVLEIIDAGSKTARTHAQETMVRVREAVFGWQKKRKEISGGGTANL